VLWLALLVQMVVVLVLLMVLGVLVVLVELMVVVVPSRRVRQCSNMASVPRIASITYNQGEVCWSVLDL